METVWKVRTTQVAFMLVLAGTMWGCGGSNETTAPAIGTTLAPTTTAVSSESASTADSGSTADSASDAGAELAAAVEATADELTAAHASKDIYGITNLAPPPIFTARINNAGQAAFEYTALDGNLHLGFFNGERIFDINPPNAEVSTLGGLNDKGEVAAQTRFPAQPSPLPFQPFRWTAKSGRVLLPRLSPEGDTFTDAINNHGEIVGASQIGPGGEGTFRAVRWTAKNRLIPLPVTAGFGESIAFDINEHNVVTGFGNDPAGNAHAFIWDASARPTDLGTFGATSAFGRFNNDRGDVAGHLDFTSPNFQAFLWSPGKGAVRIGLNTVAADLNEAGEVSGRVQRPNNDNRAFVFSRKRGFVNLHPKSFFSSEAGDLNDSSFVVGRAMRTEADIFRAYRWSPTGVAVDLNTRLLNPPKGLILTDALGISNKGDIVANSNAGLVFLRVGGGGTDAPVLGPIVLTEPRLNEVTRLTLSFRDRNAGDTHKATVDWGDGSGPQPALVREHKGKGEVSATHTYVDANLFNIVVRVTDSTGKTTMMNRQISIRPPL
jgi:hypothetical protein